MLGLHQSLGGPFKLVYIFRRLKCVHIYECVSHGREWWYTLHMSSDVRYCLASGWMIVKQRAKQSKIELPLVISDHADWNELTNTILRSNAKKVWLTHGRTDALKYWCMKNNINAEALDLIESN